MHVAMRLSSNRRYIEHNFPSDRAPHEPELFEAIDIAISEIERRLIEHMEMLISSSKSPDTEKGLYTGDLGIIYTFYTLGNPQWQKLFKTYTIHGPSPRVTFLESSMFASIIHGHRQEVIEFAERAVRLDPKDCELLYGRAGCLHGILFAKRRYPEWIELDRYIEQLAQEIINAGYDSSRQHLMWTWHHKEYLGAIHGVAGILYILLLCGADVLKKVCEDPLSLIEKTVHVVTEQYRFDQGNIMSSTDSDNDRLVHFCHGATGWIPLICLLGKYPGVDCQFYHRLANELGEVVWSRGLITNKGPGICHGIGGSICGLLELFSFTGDDKWLHRAQWFGLYLSQNWKRLNPLADRPYSLFEGMSGAYYSLSLTHMITSDPTKLRDRNSTFCGFIM
jgi:hypothetical protein